MIPCKQIKMEDVKFLMNNLINTIEKNNIALLDTSIISTPLYTINGANSFLSENLIKGQKEIIDLCFVDYPKYIRKIIQENEKVYTIPEVFNEIEKYENIIDEIIKCNKNWIKRIPLRNTSYLDENKEDINHCRMILNIIQKYKTFINDSKLAFKYLEDFDDKYESVFNIFKSTRNFRLNHPGKFYTDEHLLTTAVLTSNRERKLVDIITKDSDLLPLLKWTRPGLKGIDFEVGISNVIFNNGENYNIIRC